jgi:hypothetical protein
LRNFGRTTKCQRVYDYCGRGTEVKYLLTVRYSKVKMLIAKWTLTILPTIFVLVSLDRNALMLVRREAYALNQGLFEITLS